MSLNAVAKTGGLWLCSFSTKRPFMRKLIYALVLALPLAVAAGYVVSKKSYTCPLTGEEIPCEKCCPVAAR